MMKHCAFLVASLFALAACEGEPEEISPGQVDEASFVEKTGELWPLTIGAGTLFCVYQEVNLGDNFFFYIKAEDGEIYALNTTARLLMNEGNVKNWEDIWKRRADDSGNISLKPLRDRYVSDDSKKG